MIPERACAGMRGAEGTGSGQSAPQLPEKVMMALVSTPAVFAVPSSINKGFNPPFVLRVGVVSSLPTQIKATVAAYVLQKDQVANLEKWHPAQHVVTESLSGAIVTQKIVCHGPSHPKLPQSSPGKHTGVAEFVFSGERPPCCHLAVLPQPSTMHKIWSRDNVGMTGHCVVSCVASLETILKLEQFLELLRICSAIKCFT